MTGCPAVTTRLSRPTRLSPPADIDECAKPDACGANAICQNYPGNYTCGCPEGYVGNAYDGVSTQFLTNFTVGGRRFTAIDSVRHAALTR